ATPAARRHPRLGQSYSISTTSGRGHESGASGQRSGGGCESRETAPTRRCLPDAVASDQGLQDGDGLDEQRLDRLLAWGTTHHDPVIVVPLRREAPAIFPLTVPRQRPIA